MHLRKVLMTNSSKDTIPNAEACVLVPANMAGTNLRKIPCGQCDFVL